MKPDTLRQTAILMVVLTLPLIMILASKLPLLLPLLETTELVAAGGLVVSGISITLLIALSERFREWANRERQVEAVERGKLALIESDDFVALLAFQEALAYKDTPGIDTAGIHLGMAYALERIGNKKLALSAYLKAYLDSICWGWKLWPTAALARHTVIADLYVRALFRLGDAEQAQEALKVCQHTLNRTARLTGPEKDDLELSLGFVLFQLRREAEAREQFVKVATIATEVNIQRQARHMASVMSVVELARKGQEHFSKGLDLLAETFRRTN